MPNPQHLSILTKLREEIRPRVSQEKAARSCGLEGSQSRLTVGEWEAGKSIPQVGRRVDFMHYLWDTLRLRENPEKFAEVWQILVEEWRWEPLSQTEWRRLTKRPHPTSAPANVDDHRLNAMSSLTTDTKLTESNSSISHGNITDIITEGGIIEESVAQDSGGHDLQPIRQPRSLSPSTRMRSNRQISIASLLLLLPVLLLFLFLIRSSGISLLPQLLHALTPTPIEPTPMPAMIQPPKHSDQNTYHCFGDKGDYGFKVVITQFVERGDDLFYEDELLEKLARTIPQQVEVCSVDRQAGNAVLAREIGQELGSNIVIWGRRDALKLSAGVEIANWNEIAFNSPDWSAGEANRYQFESEEFSILINLLVNLALSKLFYWEQDSQTASQLLENTLAEVNKHEQFRTKNALYVAKVYSFLGYIHEFGDSADHWQAAVDAYETAYQLNPALSGIRLNQGNLYNALQQWDKAKQVYTELMNTSDKMPLSKADLLVNRGYVYLSQTPQDLTSAQHDFQEAMGLMPDDWSLYDQICKMQITFGLVQEAKQTYRLATCRLAPNELQVLDTALKTWVDEHTEMASQYEVLVSIMEEPQSCP